jgi:ABC-type Fe3+ transport system substrate-binding protein
MRRLNSTLFIAYAMLTLGVFVAAVISPAARALAYAPLRDLVLPGPEPIVVSVLYSTEKEAWLGEAAASFEATRPLVNGHPVKLSLKSTGSREMVLAVLDGAQKPDLISPASSLQVSILEDMSARKYGTSLVNAADPAACRPVVSTPLVLTMWRERADVLWGNHPNGNLWKHLHDALVAPQGWAAYGHPEWGYIKFGHTDPLKSNSGFMAILLMTYNYFGKAGGLTSSDILSDAAYRQWFTEFEGTISQFGDSTGTYMKDIVAYGPSVYDVVAVYEATAIEQADNAVSHYGELRIYYPPATIFSDHPFCVLKAGWVTSDKAQAARLFVDYLTSRPAQESALLKYGFRPVDKTISLDQPGSPFTRYAANGLKIDLPPVVQTPPGDVLNTLLDFWSRTTQR